MRSLLLLGLSIVPSLPAAAQPAPPPVVAGTRTFPGDAEVQDLIRSYVESGQAKGIVVGLLEPDGSRRYISAGDAGEGAAPLGANSIFEIGSITKTFTGTLLADLVRRGVVKLDDPVAKYLPADVRVPSRNGKQITLLDLATHMSGLPRLPTGYTPPDKANPYAHFAAADLYDFLNRYELPRDPGEKGEYSNLGVGLLGHALARAAGAPSLQALVQARILEPLAMGTTAYGRRPDLAAAWTKGHSQDGAVVPHFDVDVLAGAGGLNSSAADMLNYVAANVSPAQSPIGLAMREAQRGHRPGPGPGSQLGLGWMSRQREGQTLIGHGGGTAGYSTYVALDPVRRAGVVVLSNSGDFDYADYIGRELLNPNWRTALRMPPEALGEYAGTYRLREGLDLNIAVKEGRLSGQATGQPRLPLFASARDRLFYRAVNAQLSFNRDSSGRITGVTLVQGGKELTGPKID